MELDGDLIALLTNPETTNRAVQRYLKHREAQNRWYEAHKKDISEKRKAEWREKNPTPRPVGRPKKMVADPTS
jgi:acetyl-CoA acetyltransferase